MSNRHVSDWLESYLYLNRYTEVPRAYHLWTGIAAISTALRRRCYTNWGSIGIIYPNFYIALVGPAGGRKTTSMRTVEPMIHGLEVPLGPSSLGSSLRLYKEINESTDVYTDGHNHEITHRSLSFWSKEFQVFLSSQDPLLIPSLTDLYDCPDAWRYASETNKVAINNCWLTIIGAITPQMLQKLLTHDAVGGGLVSRIIFVVAYGAVRKIAFPFLTEEDILLKKHLQEDLQTISQISGPFKLDKSYYKVFGPWYEQDSDYEGVASDMFQGYNSRRVDYVKKLSMIVSASESDEMILTDHHFEIAHAILQETEMEMPNAFKGIATSVHGEVYSDILHFIENTKNFSFRELLEQKIFLDTEEHLRMCVDTFVNIGKLRRMKSASKEVRFEYVDKTKLRPKSCNILDQTIYKRLKE